MSALEGLPKMMKNSKHLVDFESGVYMGVGTFNLVSCLFYYVKGWLAHLARHSPLNTRVDYAVGLSPTGSITKQFMKQFQSVYISRQSTSVNWSDNVVTRTRGLNQRGLNVLLLYPATTLNEKLSFLYIL